MGTKTDPKYDPLPNEKTTNANRGVSKGDMERKGLNTCKHGGERQQKGGKKRLFKQGRERRG